MKKTGLIPTAVGLLLLAAVGLGLSTLIQNRQAPAPANDAAPSPVPLETQRDHAYPVAHVTQTGQAYPPPDPTLIALNQTDVAWHETSIAGPIETPPPFPTPLPTPIVTPRPRAAFPLSGLSLAEDEETFAILYQQGEALWIRASDQAEGRLLVDVQARLSRYLADEALGFRSWGSVSPDGRWLAILTSTISERSAGSQGPSLELELYAYNPQSDQLTLIIENGLEPIWSPDGRKLALRGPDQGLWVFDTETGAVGPIYNSPPEHIVTEVRWSPDGTALAFIDSVFRQSDALLVISAQGGAAEAVVPWEGYPIHTPAWSPDGKLIAYVTTAGSTASSQPFDNLWVVHPDGSERRQITWDLHVHGPAWSPAGGWLAFDGTIGYEEEAPLAEVWLLDVAALALHRLTDNHITPTNELFLGWSPDGGQVMYLRPGLGTWLLSLRTGIETRLPETVQAPVLIAPP